MDKVVEAESLCVAAQPSNLSNIRVSRNFRNLPDIENFYRFIYDNDLRAEAFLMLEKIYAFTQKASKKTKKASKAKSKSLN